MATHSVASSRSGGPVRLELLALAGLAVLTFFLVPIHINTLYSGLPAHPLFLHVPVILIPVAAIGAVTLAARPGWFERHGVWLGLVTVVGLGSLNLTMGAGDSLRADLHLGPLPVNERAAARGPFDLVARHAHAASILRVLTILFTAAFLVAIASYRTRDGSSTDLGFVDAGLGRLRRLMPSMLPARLVVAVLALGCLYFTYHAGDLGAKAAWQGRLGAGGQIPGFGSGPPGAGQSGGSPGAGQSGGAPVSP